MTASSATLFNRAPTQIHERANSRSRGKVDQRRGRKCVCFYRVGQGLGRGQEKKRKNGGDPFKAIESVISWGCGFAAERDRSRGSSPKSESLRTTCTVIGDSYSQIRPLRPPLFLEALHMEKPPRPHATSWNSRGKTLKALNADNTPARCRPTRRPASSGKRWGKAWVFTDGGPSIEGFYELCTLLRAEETRFAPATVLGPGPRAQFKDFGRRIPVANRKSSPELKQARRITAGRGHRLRHVSCGGAVLVARTAVHRCSTTMAKGRHPSPDTIHHRGPVLKRSRRSPKLGARL